MVEMEPRASSFKALSQPVIGHADGGPEEALPPYHVRSVDFLFILTEFESTAAQQALPPALQLHSTQPGFLSLYSAPSGWGLSPYTAFFAAVPVRGHDSPDGSCGYFMAEGFYSGRAGPIMHDNYNTRLVPGFSRQWRQGDVLHGEAGPNNTPVVDISLRPALPQPATPLTVGVHHYLGERRDGDLNIYSVAYSGEFFPAADVEVKFRVEASPLLRSLQPVSFPYASCIPFAPLTFSPPRPISTSASEMAVETARMSLLDVLARLGRAAAIVRQDGRVLFLNGEAEALLSGAVREGRLRTWRHNEQRDLDRALAHALEQGPSSLAEPIALAKPGADAPILAQAMPVGRALVGELAALILFSDLAGRNATDPVTALELLGLTRSEARVAALVGEGKSLREAAEALAITENTARSALQLVYGKLMIGKQSELARIVARLDGFGTPLSRTHAVQGSV